MKLVTVKQMREMERITIKEIGVPSLILMENAAMEAAKHCLSYLEENKKRRVMIVAGPGNNGGDGFALARRLFCSGMDVRLVFAGNLAGMTGDALINLNIVLNLGIPVNRIDDEPLPYTSDAFPNIPATPQGLLPSQIEACDLVVDALFGIGLSRPITGSFEYVVEMVNRYASYVIALDIPSGIHADTGQTMKKAVRADKTVTFGSPKQGLYLFPGAAYAGEIIVAHIDIPETVMNRFDLNVEILLEEEARALLPPRASRSNKGSYGRVYVISGNKEMTGSAVFAAAAAYKAGAGLVKACVPKPVALAIQAAVPEAVMAILPDENGFLCKRSCAYIAEDLSRADVLILGPGLGWNESTYEFVWEILPRIEVPLVLDADALNIISEDLNILKKLKAPTVITPHPGEMSRLTGLSIEEILDNTVEIARDFSKRFQVITVLKDARTIIATSDENICVNTTGTAALAKAGSGDVLAGLIGSFMAQGLEAFTAAKLASYLHGDAGRLAEKSLSSYGVTATDLLQSIPKVLRSYSQGENA